MVTRVFAGAPGPDAVLGRQTLSPSRWEFLSYKVKPTAGRVDRTGQQARTSEGWPAPLQMFHKCVGKANYSGDQVTQPKFLSRGSAERQATGRTVRQDSEKQARTVLTQ